MGIRFCTAIVCFSDDGGAFHHIWQAAPASMEEIRALPEIAAFSKAHPATTYGYIDYIYTTGLAEAEALRLLDVFCKEHGSADEFSLFPLDVRGWDLTE